VADSFAIDALELPAVREMLARHTSFLAGSHKALNLQPTSLFYEAQERQAETAEALKLPSLRPSLHLGGVHDVRPEVGRAAVGSTLRPEELLDIGTTARAARTWKRGLAGLRDELPVLVRLADRELGDHHGLPEAIELAISDGGEVLDSASPELGRIRTELRGAHQRLVTRLREIMGQNPFKDAVQDPVVTERAGRYVIPVRAELRTQLPAIVHDQSASGATAFVEPLAVVDMANRWRSLQSDETREVDRILSALDLSRAKATLAQQQRATQPALVEVPRQQGAEVLRLINARHPLLTGDVVPMTMELGGEFDHLLITGPNTGGKTVALKTAGLLTLMAQCGLFIPADDGSLVAVFERVQADIGDEQSLQQSLSTFSSHVKRIVAMLESADDTSLVLLDELGAGTDPQEGAALAQAVLTYLQNRGTYVVATTHYPEIKSYAHSTERVENASVEFNVETLSPTYKLTIGLPGRSNAIAIARRLGMPEEVLQAAQETVEPRTAEVEALLGGLAQERETAEDARVRALKEAAEAATLKAKARAELRAAERTRNEAADKARQELEEELAELRRDAHRLRQQLQSAGRNSREARDTIDQVLELHVPMPPAPTPTAEPERFAVGDQVLVSRLGVGGRILLISGNGAEVEVSGRRVRAKLTELEPATKAELRSAKPKYEPTILIAADRSDVGIQLDLRGQRVEEALEKLESYLHEASMAHLPEVSIIHGKGTGAMRQAVRERLRASRYVRKFASDPDSQGGDGATLATLR
jgi:DNA mismatch repair protein MutS2